MKRIIKIFIFSISINIANAQFDENNAIYSTVELNLGNYIGFDINLNYVYKEKYSFKVGYTGNIRKPESQPENYTSGLTGLFFFGLAILMTNLKIIKSVSEKYTTLIKVEP